MKSRFAALTAALSIFLVACTAPAPTSTFDGEQLSFKYPAEWNAAQFEILRTLSNAIVFLSTETMTDPCVQTPSARVCNGKLIEGLDENGVLLDWSSWTASDFFFDASKGTLTNIDGRRATVEKVDPNEFCSGFGAERQTVVTVEVPGAPNDWLQMTACVRGPKFAAADAQIDALIASVQWKA